MSDKKTVQLDKTIGSVSPEKMEETRRHVEQVMSRTGEQEALPDLPTLAAAQPSEEDERLLKLDIITDVQLVLVEKYRRAAALMWVAIIILFIGACVGVVAILFVADVGDRVSAVAAQQDKVLKAQEEAVKQGNATQEAVAETKKKVDEAVEASPKIEIDEQGKAKVVVPVRQTHKGGEKDEKDDDGGDKGERYHPPSSPPPPSSLRPKGGKKGDKAEFPIDLK